MRRRARGVPAADGSGPCGGDGSAREDPAREQGRSPQATKREPGRPSDAVVAVTGAHRPYAGRVLRHGRFPAPPPPAVRGRTIGRL